MQPSSSNANLVQATEEITSEPKESSCEIKVATTKQIICAMTSSLNNFMANSKGKLRNKHRKNLRVDFRWDAIEMKEVEHMVGSQNERPLSLGERSS